MVMKKKKSPKKAKKATKRATKKTAKAKSTVKRRTAAKRKPASRAKAKGNAKRKATAKAKPPAPRRAKRSTASRQRPRARVAAGYRRGLGSEAGGQSGDTEGLSRAATADSESVEELVEEGQAFEAGVVSGVENAPDADRGPVRTRQVPEDDVPQEYLDED